MQHFTGFIYFNTAYAVAIISFLILFYFKIEIIFITNFIVIMSITLLIVKLLYWYSIKKNLPSKNRVDKQKKFLLRSAYCIFTYIIPVYCILQEPSLVINHYVSAITFTIITVLAIIGLIIERWLYITESQQINNNAV